MSEDRPMVSVIIPTCNRLSLLRGTLERVCEQTYPRDRYEVIVVDDGSRDGTREFLATLAQGRDKHPRVRCCSQQQQGPAVARNRGLAMARGELVAFTDDDCLPAGEWLEHLVAAMADGSPAVGGLIVQGDRGGLASRFCSYAHINSQAAPGKPYLSGLNTANAICRTETLRAIGAFDATFRWPGGEDTDLAYRLREQGARIKACPQAVVTHLNRDTLRGLHRACFNRGRGHSVIHAKRHRAWRCLFSLVLWVVRATWHSVRAVVEPPFVGTYQVMRGRPAGDAYGFAVLAATTKAAKYCGHVWGLLGYMVGHGRGEKSACGSAGGDERPTSP